MSEEKSTWKKEVSAGGIVYKRENNLVFILMINPKSRDFGPPEDYWTWPKGKQDKEGENLEQVALREVREEGGVNAQIEAELGYQKYFRSWAGDQAIKFVHYYLMKFIDGDPADHDQEVAEAAWVELEKVDARLKWPTDKDVWSKAKQILNAR